MWFRGPSGYVAQLALENFLFVVLLFVRLSGLCLQDELARVLVTLFDSRHLLYQLLWNMFSKEVELADSMQTLFRGNSLASKIMTFCFKVGICSVSTRDGRRESRLS